MNKHLKRNILIITGVIAFHSVHAIEPMEVDSLIRLNSLVVSANRIEVNRNSVPLTISVINWEKIESSSESALLPVLSEQVPGLFVTEKGITGFGVSTGAAGTINIRGVGSGNKVLVLFDGQPQWAGIFGHSLPDTYVASDVEKVEVIRGPGSLLYGSNAMGGVINIITRRQHQTGRRTQARIMYGSYNTQKYMASNGYNAGNFSSFISINHDRTDGHRPNSKFHITNGFANLGYRFNDIYKVTGDVSLAKYKFQNPGQITNPIFDNKMDILRGTTSLGLENNYKRAQGAVRLFYNWGNHEINDGYYSGEKPKDYLFRSDDHNLGVLLYESFRLFPGNNFTVGIDYKNWGGHAWNDKNDGSQQEIIDKSVNETAGYIIMQQDFFEKFGINAALQPESFSDHGRHAEEKETEEQTAAARRNGFHEHRFFAAVGVTLFWGGVFPPQQSSAVQPTTQTQRHHLCTSKCCCVSSSGATSTNTVSESSAGAYPNCRARAFTAAGSAARLRSSDN